MASTTTITCKCGCGRKKEVRTADVARGWGLYFSKSCKAKHQEKRTGQYRKYLMRSNEKSTAYHEDNIHPLEYGHIFESGDAGHGQE